jgi:hypothetical protein
MQVMRSNVQLRLARTGWSETIAVTGSSAIDTGMYTSSSRPHTLVAQGLIH